MDDFIFFWGLIFLIGLILFFGIPYLIFFILKKLGKPNLGKIIGTGIFAIFLLFTTYVIFEDHFFFKNSARKELKEMNLVLNDDFEILKNESGGFTDYYQIFELKISENDMNRLIENKKAESNSIIITRKDIDINVWKIIKVDTESHILTYEYIIN